MPDTTPITPADELRTAAQLLRELATAASTDESGRPTARWAVRYRPGVTPGAPPQTDRSCYLDAVDEADADGRGARRLLHGTGGTRGRAPSVAPQHGRYIAAMDPATGLALAEWLEAEAGRLSGPDTVSPHALAVARLVLGTETVEVEITADAGVLEQALGHARLVLGTTDQQPETTPTPADLIRDRVAEWQKDCVWIEVDGSPMILPDSWPDAQSLLDAIHTAAGLDGTETAPDDRRDRYVAAIRDTDGWVLDDGQHMVDAVMAVADAEQVELRAQIANLRTMYNVADARTSDLIDERDQLLEAQQPDTIGLCADCGVPRETHHHGYVRTPHAADEAQQPETEAGDTLSAWLHQRFAVTGPTTWANLDDDQRSYWEHQAKAVRRAVARGGFKPAADQPDTETEAAPWAGATELAPDREIRTLAATGLVGYRQGNGRLLHCLAHKPAPASRWADFHEVTAEDLDDGGICVHPRCGRDLLAAWPAP